MMALVRTDGTVERLPQPVTIDQVQQHVGGWAEAVRSLHDPMLVAYCNETAAITGGETNVAASLIIGRPLLGPVVLFGGEDNDGNELPLTDEQWHLVEQATS